MVDIDTAATYNDHNVYILGAGFSAEAGYPLIKDFMHRMRDAATWLQSNPQRERERKAIERVLKFRLSAAAAAYRVPLNIENAEELFSLATVGGDNELAQDMTLAIAATLDFAQITASPLNENQFFGVGVLNVPGWTKPKSWSPPSTFLRNFSQNDTSARTWYSCSPYEYYLGLMCGYFEQGDANRRNTIISLNYDLIVENALRNLGIGYTYAVLGNKLTHDSVRGFVSSPLQDEALKLLKLHGSINWYTHGFYKREQAFANIAEIGLTLEGDPLTDLEGTAFVNRVSAALRQVSVYDSYTDLKTHKEGGMPFLVPPTWSKSLTVPLTDVWNQAVAALRTATRIIIMGYSIPATDLHFRYLVAAGLQENISLRKIFFVNSGLAEHSPQKQQLKERLLSLFRPEHFEQGTVEAVPIDIRTFLAGPQNMEERSYRLAIGRTVNAIEHMYDTANTAPWKVYTGSGSSFIIV